MDTDVAMDTHNYAMDTDDVAIATNVAMDTYVAIVTNNVVKVTGDVAIVTNVALAKIQ